VQYVGLGGILIIHVRVFMQCVHVFFNIVVGWMYVCCFNIILCVSIRMHGGGNGNGLEQLNIIIVDSMRNYMTEHRAPNNYLKGGSLDTFIDILRREIGLPVHVQELTDITTDVQPVSYSPFPPPLS